MRDRRPITATLPLAPPLLSPIALLLGAAVGISTRRGTPLTIGLLVAIVAVVATVLRPWSVIVVGGVLGPLCSGLRRGLPVPLLRSGEVLLLVAAAVAIAAHRPAPPVRRRHLFELTLVAYVGATVLLGAISTRRSGGALGTEQLGVLLVPVFHALAYLSGRAVATDEVRSRRVLRGLLVGSSVLSTLAIAQTIGVGPVRTMLGTIGDQSSYTGNVDAGYVARATGLFNHWHLLAGYLVVILAVAVSLSLRPDPRVLGRRALGIVIALDVAALTLTLTYTAFAGALGAVALVGVLHGRGRLVLRRIGIVVAAAALVFSGALAHRAHDQFAGGGRTSSSSLLPQTVQFRLAVWQDQFLPAIEERPVLGWGATTPDAVLWPFSESVYLTLLLRGGVALLSLYVAMWAAMILRALDASRRTRQRTEEGVQGVVAPAVVGAATVLIPMQALFPYFTSPGVPHLLLLLCGLAFAPARPAPTPTAQSRSVQA